MALEESKLRLTSAKVEVEVEAKLGNCVRVQILLTPGGIFYNQF